MLIGQEVTGLETRAGDLRVPRNATGLGAQACRSHLTFAALFVKKKCKRKMYSYTSYPDQRLQILYLQLSGLKPKSRFIPQSPGLKAGVSEDAS